jgi:tRNA pseudouridine38-40 synthase
MSDLTERNFSARVAYEGTAYAGFQIQPDEPTVQGELEKALNKVLGSEIRIHGASRTDAGVHAVGQSISFKAATLLPAEEIERAVNAVIAQDVRIGPVVERDADFSARYSARGKLYKYRIFRGERESVFLNRYSLWIWGGLDLKVMRQTAEMFTGERDFSSFSPRLYEGENPVKRLDKVEIAEHGDLLEIDVGGSGFLYQMVRRICAAVVEAGRGDLKPGEISSWLESPGLGACKHMLAAKGLFLMEVFY